VTSDRERSFVEFCPSFWWKEVIVDNNTGSNNHINIDADVISTAAITVEVHTVYVMNADSVPGQTSRLGLWVHPYGAVVYLLLLISPKADTHFTVPHTVEGWVDLRTAERMYSQCPRLYIVRVAVVGTDDVPVSRTFDQFFGNR